MGEIFDDIVEYVEDINWEETIDTTIKIAKKVGIGLTAVVGCVEVLKKLADED